MNKLIKTIMLLAVGMTAACSSDNEEAVTTNGVMQKQITITAIYGEEQPATRVEYTENNKTISATWQADDKLLVAYDGYVSTLNIADGIGSGTATFTGTISYHTAPTENSVLSCYVQDKNNPTVVQDNGDGTIVYSDASFLTQDGTVAGAGKCNTYHGMTTYGDGSAIRCAFSVNTSILKFTVATPYGVNAGDDATLTYKSGDTELCKASFKVGSSFMQTIYLAVPAGSYSGTQAVVYKSGDKEVTRTLSTNRANFVTGQTYSKKLFFGLVQLSWLTEDYIAVDGDILTGTLYNYHRLSIADGATVTLRNVNIGQRVYDYPEFSCLACLGTATIILEEGTTNNIGSYYVMEDDEYPTIVHSCLASLQPGPAGSTLTIKGSGRLNVGYTDDYGIYSDVAIGSRTADCGDIVIEDGIVTAIGSSVCIGSFPAYTCGNITISGGIVTCGNDSGTNGAYAIYSKNGNINITDDVNSLTVNSEYLDQLISSGTGTVTIDETTTFSFTTSETQFEHFESEMSGWDGNYIWTLTRK